MGEVDVSLPLSSLSYEFRVLLSNLLNPKRILTTSGPTQLPRDWRGLACLLNITSELAASIRECPDRTAKLLEIWIQKKDDTANIKTLLQYLTQLDRYDVHDDILDLAMRGRIIGPNPLQNNTSPSKDIWAGDESMILTHDDRKDGFPHYYHAYVLFAQQDWKFVRELLARMRAAGFKLCTEYDIDIGYGTQYAPVAQLISERCNRIILVYSPDFLVSPANSFYTDHAQAVGIEKNKRNIIPIIYRECRLPPNLTYYHRLVYSPRAFQPYDFWEKLAETLQRFNVPNGINGVPSNNTKIMNTASTSLPTEQTATITLNGHSAGSTASSASAVNGASEASGSGAVNGASQASGSGAVIGVSGSSGVSSVGSVNGTEETAQLDISLMKNSFSSTSSQSSSEKKKSKTVKKVWNFITTGKTKKYIDDSGRL